MDWDDVALTNAIRFLEHNFWTTKGGNTSVFSYTSAGTLLITAMLKSNATELNLDVKGVSVKGCAIRRFPDPNSKNSRIRE